MTFLGDDKKILVYELILSLVSLWLLVNSIKKGKSQINVRLIYFLFILLKDTIILYYYFTSFSFQRGYGMTERSDFILIEINGCYNMNDRWKYILFFD